SVQTAISSSFGTPNCCWMRPSSAACFPISVLARLMRGGITRERAYSSKLFEWHMRRGRRSKASTFGSRLTPAKAWSMTARETPAACASRAMPAMKTLKSPPHLAAEAGAANSATRKNAEISLSMDGPWLPPRGLTLSWPGLSRPRPRRGESRTLGSPHKGGPANAQRLLGHDLSRDQGSREARRLCQARPGCTRAVRRALSLPRPYEQDLRIPPKGAPGRLRIPQPRQGDRWPRQPRLPRSLARARRRRRARHPHY